VFANNFYGQKKATHCILQRVNEGGGKVRNGLNMGLWDYKLFAPVLWNCVAIACRKANKTKTVCVRQLPVYFK